MTRRLVLENREIKKVVLGDPSFLPHCIRLFRPKHSLHSSSRHVDREKLGGFVGSGDPYG